MSHETLNKVLHKALTTRRRRGSQGEMSFVAWLASTYPPDIIDQAGNLHWDRRGKRGGKTLFVGHTDTVHNSRQDEIVNPVSWEPGWARATDKQILGADNGAGLAMMMHLMMSGVAGYYIATRGEECGGDGSKYLVDEEDLLLSSFDRAITFDRKAYSSIITYQAGDRCCSDEFAEALSKEFKAQGLKYEADPGGIFTDTALYVGLIPECTNLSVGYFNAHSLTECLDLDFFARLAKAVLKINWHNLPVVRSPGYDEDLLDLEDALASYEQGNKTQLNALIADFLGIPQGLIGSKTEFDTASAMEEIKAGHSALEVLSNLWDTQTV